MTRTERVLATRIRLWTATGLFLLVALAIWLRFAGLDNLGLERNEDEDIMGIAVMGIAEHGEPRFPSGMVYLRSLPITYLMAASTGLLGLNEIGLRAPSALFGTVLVLLTFFVCRRYFGLSTALIAIFLVSVSFWQVDVSRTARMYAPFGVFYLAAVFTACLGYIEGRRRFQWLCLLLTILATLVHTLGVVFGGVLLALALRPSQDRPARAIATINAALLAVIYLALPPMDTSGLPPDESLAIATAESTSGILGTLSGLANVFVIPPFQLLSGGAIGVTLATAILVIAIFSFYLYNQKQLHRLPTETLAALAVVAFGAACHQFIIAMLGLIALAMAGWPKHTKLIGSACLFFLTAGVGWTVYGLHLTGGDVEATLKQMLGYPEARQWISFVEHRWIAAVFGILGAILALREAIVARQITARSFLAIVVGFTLIAHSILNSQFRTRYNFAVDSLFLILVAHGCWSLMVWTARRAKQRAVALLATPVALLVALDLGAYYSLRLPNVTDASASGILGSSYELRPDYRGAALYVKEHMASRDEVMATDWLTVYFYTRKVDYLLRGAPLPQHEWMQRSTSEGAYELYLFARWIDTNEALQNLLSRPCGSNLWIITSGLALDSDAKELPDWQLMKSLLAIHHVYSGGRQSTDVYLVPAPVCDLAS